LLFPLSKNKLISLELILELHILLEQIQAMSKRFVYHLNETFE